MTNTLRQVFKVNIRQANTAHAEITEIAATDGTLPDGDRMMLALKMGESIKTRQNAIRVIKRNLSVIGNANLEILADALHPDVYQMLKG